MFLIFYVLNKEISTAYISKIKSNCEKQIILLMICIRFVLHPADFFCLNGLHYFVRKNKLKSHEKLSKNQAFYGIVMPSEKENIVNQ